MSKQVGVFKINGTIDDTMFYEEPAAFYARLAPKDQPKQGTLPDLRFAQTAR